jgi:hypothetical protein
MSTIVDTQLLSSQAPAPVTRYNAKIKTIRSNRRSGSDGSPSKSSSAMAPMAARCNSTGTRRCRPSQFGPTAVSLAEVAKWLPRSGQHPDFSTVTTTESRRRPGRCGSIQPSGARQEH